MQLKHSLGIAIFFLFFLSSYNMKAQVNIGSKQNPAKATLLDLKVEIPNNPTSPNDIKNVTSTKGGLILPRVKLKDLLTLEPFLDPTGADYADQKLLSVGLMVYNLTDNANLNLQPSIYYWDGMSWNRILYTIY